MPRYSAKNGDRGVAFCDGKALDMCEEVDTDLGFAVVVETDEKGALVMEGGKLKRRLVLGRMEYHATFAPLASKAALVNFA